MFSSIGSVDLIHEAFFWTKSPTVKETTTHRLGNTDVSNCPRVASFAFMILDSKDQHWERDGLSKAFKLTLYSRNTQNKDRNEVTYFNSLYCKDQKENHFIEH